MTRTPSKVTARAHTHVARSGKASLITTLTATLIALVTAMAAAAPPTAAATHAPAVPLTAAAPPAPAVPPTAPAPAAGGLPLPAAPGLSDYLASFDAAYLPPDHVTLALVDAEAAVRRAGWATAPRVGMEQTLRLIDFTTLALDVTTDVAVPLYAARQPLESAIAAAALEHQRATAEATRADARARFAGDVLAYALLSAAADDLSRALVLAHAQGWPGTVDATDPARIPAASRDAYLQQRKLADLLAFLRSNVDDLRRALARDTQLAPAALVPPPPAETLASFSAAPPTHARCLREAPAAHDARARHRQRALQDALSGTPAATVDLVAELGARSAAAGAPITTPMGLRASIALEGRIAIPSTWPVKGEASASVDLAGIRQSLRVEWPPRPTPVLEAGRSADLVLADELDALDANLRALRRSLDQASSRRAERALRLAWFVQDVAPPTDPRDRPTNGEQPLPEPIADLHAAELRTNLAFARLDEALAWIELRLACGAGV